MLPSNDWRRNTLTEVSIVIVNDLSGIKVELKGESWLFVVHNLVPYVVWRCRSGEPAVGVGMHEGRIIPPALVRDVRIR